jgi:methionine synthase / methylenetetrahydrofolate reductase(NADPH)
MGTMLYSRGVFINRCFDELCVSAPDIVRQIHKEYVDAGAEIIETNTFGATRVRLSAFGYGNRVREINQAGVRLARQAVGERGAFVAGAVGPLGVRIEPLGQTSFAEARSAFREQIDALLEAGVDLLVFETFGSLDELREAIYAARDAAGDSIPLIAQITIDDFGRLSGGAEPETFTPVMDSWPVDAIGVNCSVGPKATLEVIERMRDLTSKPLSAMPNAGLPQRVENRNIYLCSPEYMAQYARRLLLAGVRIVGGCCGTTPDHIRLICSETRSLNPSRAVPARRVESQEVKAKALEPAPLASKSALAAKLAEGKFVTFVEILPPRGVNATAEIAGAHLCAEHGIDCINVPDGPRASSRMSSLVACQLIQQHAGIEAINHFCCRDRNILGIQSELLGAHAAGIRNMLCITGDPPRMGSYPDATAVFDVDSIGLINIIRNLNRGLDIGGNPMGSQTALLIGAGANPGAINMDEELRRFEWKVEAGAEFAITQPVFDLGLLENFLKRIDAFRIPIICGIWPLTSYRNAEFMVNELRAPVPEEFMERMRRADSPEKASREGVSIARQMVSEVRNMVQGVQLSAPFGRYQLALDVADAAGPVSSKQNGN